MKTTSIPGSRVNRTPTWTLAMALLCAGSAGILKAQTPTPVATGLLRPAKIIQSPLGHHLVAEVGTSTPNSSRVSILDAQGNRRTLVDGLPSGTSALHGLVRFTSADLGLPGILQAAPEVTGPWSDLLGVTSPHATATAESRKFFRVKIP